MDIMDPRRFRRPTHPHLVFPLRLSQLRGSGTLSAQGGVRGGVGLGKWNGCLRSRAGGEECWECYRDRGQAPYLAAPQGAGRQGRASGAGCQGRRSIKFSFEGVHGKRGAWEAWNVGWVGRGAFHMLA